MKRPSTPIALAICFAVLLAAIWYFSRAMFQDNWSAEPRATLSGNTPSVVHSMQPVGRTSPARKVKIVIGLKLKNEAALDALLTAQADPHSPEFKHYLTPSEFARRFAPDQAEYDKVVAFVQSRGLTVTTSASNRLIVGAEGTVDQVEKAFSVAIKEYNWDGQTYFSNDADPQIPASLRQTVESVIGLSSFAQFRAKNKPSQKEAGSKVSLMGLTPEQVATAYGFPNAYNKAAGTKYSGKGITVAIATAYNYSRSDVDEYWRFFGVKRTGSITDIPVNGCTSRLNRETTLDLEQVGAQAPGADVLMYLGSDPAFSTFTLVFNQIVTDNKADVISVSWGLCERDTGVAQMNTEHAIFKQANAQGIPIFAASGDDGAYDCKDTEAQPDGRKGSGDKEGKAPAGKSGSGSKTVPPTAVDYPSSDPYVVAVGGTTLYLDDDNGRAAESAWSGAGGGISSLWPRPSWQNGKGLPANNSRNSADVALAADPWTGYAVYYQGSWSISGGTSFAAPNWAALWALIDEACKGRTGHAHELLYEAGQSGKYGTLFHDITIGNNGDGRGPGYNAGPNWDHPTGWGTPRALALCDWIKDNHAIASPPSNGTPPSNGAPQSRVTGSGK